MKSIKEHLPEASGKPTDTKALYQQLTEQGKQQTAQHLREVNRQSSMNTENTSSGSQLMDRHFTLLWQRLSEIYGHKLVSSYGPHLPDMWREALASMSVQEIKTGIQSCLESGEEWPPTLPVFIKLCRGKPDDWEHGTAAYRIVDKSRLIEQQPDPEVVADAMQKLREALGAK